MLTQLKSIERCQKCKADKGWTRCLLPPKCEEECIRHYQESEKKENK